MKFSEPKISHLHLKEVIQKTKNKGDRRYLQFVESVRTEKGPRQNILVNLGRIDNKDGRERLEILTQSLVELAQTVHLVDFDRDIEGKLSKQLGCELIVRRLFTEIGLESILQKTFTSVNTDFDVKDAVFNLVLNRLSAPSSKQGVVDWQESEHQVKLFDIHHYYRAMDYLQDHQEILEKEIYSQIKSLSKARSRDLSIALFDTTSVVYYGEGDEEESFLDYGFSKARRSDLKQIVVGVAMTKDGLPISHQAYSGNTNDVTCFKEIIEKFAEKHGEKKVTFVGDRGLISHKNIEHLVSSGYQYILGFRMRTIAKAERAAIIDKANLSEIKEHLEYRDIEYKGNRLIVYYNDERGEKDRKKREEILGRNSEKIKGGSTLR